MHAEQSRKDEHRDSQLDADAVVESGAHDELLEKSGLYSKLARIQNTTFIEESYEKLIETLEKGVANSVAGAIENR